MFVRGILLLGFIISIGLCFVQPKMHPQLFIYNSDYDIVQTEVEEEKTVEKIPVLVYNRVCT